MTVKKQWICMGWGQEEWLLVGHGFLGGDEKVLELESGDGCSALGMHLMLLDCTL